MKTEDLRLQRHTPTDLRALDLEVGSWNLEVSSFGGVGLKICLCGARVTT